MYFKEFGVVLGGALKRMVPGLEHCIWRCGSLKSLVLYFKEKQANMPDFRRIGETHARTY